MRILTVLDAGVRIIAAIAAVPAVLLVLLLAIMATDSGTRDARIAAFLVFILGGSVILWVVLCSIRPQVAAGWLPPWRALRILLVNGSTYATTTAVLLWCALYAYGHLWTDDFASTEVRATEAGFPALNPRPSHPLEVYGKLPAAIPVSALLAVYETNVPAGRIPRGPCWRGLNDGKSTARYARPLRRTEVVPITRQVNNYRATVFVDRFLPGRCDWTLKEVSYRLHVNGANYDGPLAGYGKIEVLDAKAVASEAAKGISLYEGAIDLWCGEGRNHNISPYWPETCGDANAFITRSHMSGNSTLPTPRPQNHWWAVATPSSASVEFNFHDAAAAVSGSS